MANFNDIEQFLAKKGYRVHERWIRGGASSDNVGIILKINNKFSIVLKTALFFEFDKDDSDIPLYCSYHFPTSSGSGAIVRIFNSIGISPPKELADISEYPAKISNAMFYDDMFKGYEYYVTGVHNATIRKLGTNRELISNHGTGFLFSSKKDIAKCAVLQQDGMQIFKIHRGIL